MLEANKVNIKILVLLCVILLLVGCNKENTSKKQDTNNKKNAFILEEEMKKETLEVFYADEENISFVSTKVEIEELTTEEMMTQLSLHKIVSPNTKVLDFTVDKKEETVLYLNMNQSYLEYLNELRAQDEQVAIGGLVNTFLRAYQANKMLITIEGASLQTKNQTYNSFLQWYSQVGSIEQEYEMIENVEENNIVKIKYPQITNMSDASVQAAFNTMLMRVAIEYEADGLLFYSLNYEVATMNRDMLSIVYYGNLSYEGAPYPISYAITFNFDMKENKLIRLHEFTDTKALEQAFQQGEFTVIKGTVTVEEIKNYVNNLNDVEENAENKNLLDFSSYDIDTTKGDFISNGYSYIKDNQPIVIIKVNHAMGDYVQLKLNQKINLK